MSYFLTHLSRKIESFFGYSKLLELIISSIFGIFSNPYIWFFFKNNANKKIVIVSLTLPSYIDHIFEVLIELKNKGYIIVIFPEWDLSVHKLNKNLKKIVKSNFKIFFGCSRILPLLNASLFISSTTVKEYYFPRKAKRLFYFHSVVGMELFPPKSLQAFDVILSATHQQFEQLTEKFGSNKKILQAGYPKFDKIIKRLDLFHNKQTNHGHKTIVYAPTFLEDHLKGINASIFYQSENIINQLIESGFKVIFRPHPLSLKNNYPFRFIKKIKEKFEKKIILDFDYDYFHSYHASSAMLTDYSGTSLIYRFAFKKPVLFCTPNLLYVKREFPIVDKLGKVIQEIDNISFELNKILKDKLSDSDENFIFNKGNSLKIFTNIIHEELKN